MRGKLAMAMAGALALGGLVLAASAPPPPDAAAPASDDPALLRAAHRDGDGRFFNPWIDERRSLWRLIRWQILSRNPHAEAKEEPPEVPVVPNDGAALARPLAPGRAALTWVGHATVAVQDGDQVFLTDPHWGPRALVVPREVPPGIPLASIPDDAFAVVSHNHYDHLDAHTVEALPASLAWYVPLGHGGFFRERGRERVVELDWWESARHGRFTVTCLPSQHWSRRLTVPTNAWLWCSWLVDSGTRRYYFAGDTGFFHGFEAFGRLGPVDVALLPIGAYEPRWFMRDQHVDPAEAYQAFLDLRARLMVGIHWGTFDLTDEPLDLPPRELARVVAARGGDPRVRVLAVGERIELPPPARTPRGTGPAEGLR